uniref:Uncharacterized protein n=1 Tax=Cacopsylla melanoneura TaxID=428564 RepID=A0A8D8XEN5_9HEMI
MLLSSVVCCGTGCASWRTSGFWRIWGTHPGVDPALYTRKIIMFISFIKNYTFRISQLTQVFFNKKKLVGLYLGFLLNEKVRTKKNNKKQITINYMWKVPIYVVGM